MQPFNKYYPPDYDGKSNINKMAGTHALGRRAHKLNQGILIVRFELPFNIWCGSCNKHIGQGVRFNAEKKRVGQFYSTPIWSFRMKCHLCSAWFEVRTDPENTRYVVVEGAKKQADEWDTSEQGVVQFKGMFSVSEAGGPGSVGGSVSMGFVFQRLILGTKEKEQQDDPFYMLEKEEEDKSKASEQHQQISELYSLSSRQWSDPWTQSQKLRKLFREDKKIHVAKKAATEEIRTRSGLHIDLLPETEEDGLKASMVEYDGPGGRENELRMRELKMGGLVLGKRDRRHKDSKQGRNELERIVRVNTREQVDPFLRRTGRAEPASSLGGVVKVVKKKGIENGHGNGLGNGNGHTMTVGLVDGYSSESD
jgi:coiled-coil domain-containing protein 130